jgi:hypothetical protein
MANRPRGRPEKATIEVKQLISEAYVELSKGGERPYVEDVYKKLGEKLAERKKPLTLAKSTVRRIMQELKDEAGRTQEEEAELDQPWSIGASLSHGLPPDITPTLLEIQRWCILTGESFSVREARWVGYLQHTWGMELLANATWVGIIHHYAYRYGLRERASKLLGKSTIDTADLDIEQMRWDSWVRETAEQTGAIPPREDAWKKEWEEQLQLHQADYERGGPTLVAEVKRSLWSFNSPEFVLDRKLHLDTPLDTPIYLEGQAPEIYALCIFYLSKGPKWDRLTKQERDIMAATLKADIRIYQLEVQVHREKAIQDNPFYLFVLHGPKFEDWKIPASYLKTVGYNTDAPNQPREIEAPEEKGDIDA